MLSRFKDTPLGRLAAEQRRISAHIGPPDASWHYSYIHGPLYGGGGYLGWFVDGQTAAVTSYDAWSLESGLVIGDYGQTAEGGPYVWIGGSEWLEVNSDKVWANPGPGVSLFIASVFCPTSLAGDGTLIAKGDSGGERCYRLECVSTPELRGSVNSDGSTWVDVNSTYTMTTGHWHFGAFYFEPGAQLSIWLGTTHEDDLTLDILAAGVPASVYAGNGHPRAGAGIDDGDRFTGGLGPSIVRFNVPAANVEEYVYQLYELARPYYQTAVTS